MCGDGCLHRSRTKVTGNDPRKRRRRRLGNVQLLCGCGQAIATSPRENVLRNVFKKMLLDSHLLLGFWSEDKSTRRFGLFVDIN